MRRPLLALALLSTSAAADPPPEDSPQIEELEIRGAFFDQTGHGFQSVARKNAAGAGSEDTLIWEPLFHVKIKQNPEWSHTVDVSVDVVSNASVDAIDAMTHASEVNEAVTLDVQSAHKADDTTLAIRYGGHLEEPWRSLFLGGGWTRSLADDNAAIGVSVLGTLDIFDHVDRVGNQEGLDKREALNLNVSASQILSPTTVVDASYGFTLQTGSLTTTYNSVPFTDGLRGDEVFPGRRYRNAFAARISQHIPATRSTLKASYRFYVDNYDLDAHTVEGQFYQYLADWLYVRASYRYHRQSGVDFYGTAFIASTTPGAQTADSDLAPFTAHEIGAKVVFLADRSPWSALRRSFIEASYYRYFRSNDLDVNWLMLAFGKKF